MALKFDPSQNPFTNRSFQQLQESLQRLQKGKRIATSKNPDAGILSKAVNSQRDTVQISPEALAKMKQAALQNSAQDLAEADMKAEAKKQPPVDLSVLAQKNSGNALALFDSPQTAQTDTTAPGQTEQTEQAATQEQTPALATTATLGNIKITNIQEVTDTEGNRTGATGEIDLSNIGLGKVAVDLQLEGDEVVGATSQQNQFKVNVGGNTFTVNAPEEGNILTVNSQGDVTLAGSASVDIAGQQLGVSNAEITVGKDDQGNDTVQIQGTFGQGTGQSQVSIDINSSGILNAEVSAEVVTDLVPGFDQVSDFLSRVGVDVGTETGASLSFNKKEGSLAVEAFGISGSFNQTTGEFSIGGLEVEAGIGISLNDLTVNTKTGAVSGSVSAGVGVGVGDIGIGVDLAGFDFAFDPTKNEITLTGTQGIAAANLQVTAVLGQNNNGQFTVKSVDFKANLDEKLAQDVAAGLNEAFQQGQALGKEAVQEFGRLEGQGQQAVQNFAKGLQQAGGRIEDFISQTQSLAGNQLNQFLSTAASAGDQFGTFLDEAGRFSGTQLNQFLSSASSAGNRLGSFLNQTANLAGNDINNFLSAAKNSGNQIGKFLSTAGELGGSNLSNFLAAASSKGSQINSFVNSFSSTLNDIKKISGGVANLSVDRNGNFSGQINVPGAGSMNVSFSRNNGNLTAKGNLNIGGFGFSNAEITFNRSGGISSVEGGARLKTPSFKIFGKRFGSQSIGFSLQLDKSGNVVAKGDISLNMGFLGRHGVEFTLGSNGISARRL